LLVYSAGGARWAWGWASFRGRGGGRWAPRGRTTLVAWEDPDPDAARDRITEQGVVIRNLPGTKYLRASVGAWNDESDLERLLAVL
jgi:L-cysteine/cystine lyase